MLTCKSKTAHLPFPSPVSTASLEANIKIACKLSWALTIFEKFGVKSLLAKMNLQSEEDGNNQSIIEAMHQATIGDGELRRQTVICIQRMHNHKDAAASMQQCTMLCIMQFLQFFFSKRHTPHL